MIYYIYETCAWTQTMFFLSMICVESLSCKLEWGLAQAFAISTPLAIVVMEYEAYEMPKEMCKGNFCRFV